MFINIFHKFFHPHCIECKEQEELEFQRRNHNPANELLMQLLEAERHNNRQLLNRILGNNETENSHLPVTSNAEKQAVKKFIPWAQQREILEAADRKRAETLRNRETEISGNIASGIGLDRTAIPKQLTKEEEIAKLEKELGVS